MAVRDETETRGHREDAQRNRQRDEAQHNRQQRNGGAEQIEGEQDQFLALEERYQRQIEEQSEEVKRQMRQANEIARQALSQYLRAATRGYQAFVPQVAINPRQAVDLAADFVVQATEIQRSLFHELISRGQLNARAASRAVDGDSADR